MRAYGYTQYPLEGWRFEKRQTEGLRVHEFGGKFILVIRVGHDGHGPLGLGLDTAAISFVSTERSSIEAAAAACIAWLKSHGEIS